MPKAKFLVKPMYEGKSMRCDDYHFDLTCNESIRVHKLEDARLGITDLTEEEYYLLRGHQPIFFFQECFAADRPGFDWNGYLLFSVKKNIEDARKVALANKEKLNIVLSFTDPEYDRYYMLIDTKLDGGSEEEHDQWAKDILDTQVSRYFHKARIHKLDAYCNALLPQYYDIIDREALFPENVESSEFSVESDPHQTSLNTHRSPLSKIKAFFSHLINH